MHRLLLGLERKLQAKQRGCQLSLAAACCVMSESSEASPSIELASWGPSIKCRPSLAWMPAVNPPALLLLQALSRQLYLSVPLHRPLQEQALVQHTGPEHWGRMHTSPWTQR